MASTSGPPAFRLGTYGGWEDGADVDTGQRGLGAVLPPMDSPYVPEDRNFSPQIKVNLNYRKAAGARQLALNHFDRDRLFSAAARGDSEDLAGLLEYLRTTSKYLTDPEYTEGSTGKTCLMKAVLNLQKGANACILPLLQIDRDSGNPRPLVNAQCTDEYYRGHSALHIAIEKRSLQCVRLLVENGADVHARACGRFFQRKSQGTCFYFGELPLSLAACTNQWDVVAYLLENQHKPANLDEADSLGNTVLHALVMIADNSAENSALVTHMYDRLLHAGASLYPSLRLEDIPNRQGLTPLKLAAQEGKMEIFRHILQREISGEHQCLSRKFTEWCYGPVQVSLYDMASVDSCEENSVLEIITFHCRSPRFPRLSFLPQLWCFWRRRLFIWISFLDSYFELLLYVGPHSSISGPGGQEDGEGSEVPYRGIVDTALELFKFTIGMGELAFQEQLRFRGAVLLLLLAYVLLTYILLLNMLIALMNETITSVNTDSWSIWKRRAISVLEVENGYWWCRRKKQPAGVKLRVGTRPDGSPDERWCFRSEEVNWAAWEQTLPTVREEPVGPGDPGTRKSPDPANSPGKDGALEEDHLPLQPLTSH
ncbi:PREDICTED: transient receptor potential cation channel subfamily V member 2 [Myotis davidii]|uniref:transient receptor potential cation channel subfamily V member 2 n=1 Tax=Myotis davidii TaxID=225400 RepID=UPI000767DBED|nr:PREDICTED: transient receptor potential cation channel subfamily V member 2 [Myotis davidii]